MKIEYLNRLADRMEHPYLSTIRNLGCSDESKIMLAFQSYIELCNDSSLSDVQCFYSRMLDIIYIKCRSENSSLQKIYVPIPAEFQISLSWISDIQEQTFSDDTEKSVILLIRDRDSNCVHYNLTPGLIPPLSVNCSRKRKRSNEYIGKDA